LTFLLLTTALSPQLSDLALPEPGKPTALLLTVTLPIQYVNIRGPA
jgi:hypothetical protein